MSHEPGMGAPGAQGTGRLSGEPERPAPPRPPLSDHTPAPIREILTPPPAVKRVRFLWILSFASGVIAGIFAFFAREAIQEHVRGLINGLERGDDQETVEALAVVVFWGTLGLLALVILVEAVLLAVLMRRHGKVRFVLLAMLLVHGLVTLLADAFLAAPGDQELGIRVLLVMQLALAGAAVVASVLNGAGQWFRAEKQTRGHPA
ncbi:hypothetical protein, partial [Arthrobacter sp.]|uniref:hypothetical protein n=1 Tax=Arthrobacter sp. TaxID=1667 RepID=UPI0033987D35